MAAANTAAQTNAPRVSINVLPDPHFGLLQANSSRV
jgi:hypothetical protein